jgi:hypothetical protein
MAVMSVVATAMMAVAFRSFTTTATITNRRDVLVDGRTAIDQMTKQLRQAESVDLAASSDSTITFQTYIDGTTATVIPSRIAAAVQDEVRRRMLDPSSVLHRAAWWCCRPSDDRPHLPDVDLER